MMMLVKRILKPTNICLERVSRPDSELDSEGGIPLFTTANQDAYG